ncbi:MAG TPA: transposase [Terracidiphilus sp.]|jgi:putative transposase|nr:transposase [Terracidiphilus sp.]
MPDGLYRLHHSGQTHFLTFSCYHRQPFLAQMNMQEEFLLALESVRRRFRMRVYAYVVMPEHVHLLVSEPPDGTVAKTMETLKTRIAVRARQEKKRTAGGSPFWQARYFDHNVRNHAGFVTQLRYVHRNPVKRGLCSKPEEYPWTSFRAWASGEIGPVEIENEWTALRREAGQGSWPPTLAPERRREDGAREILAG